MSSIPSASSFAWIPVMGILFPVFMLAVILGFVALMRYLRYRERVLMVERGVVTRGEDPLTAPLPKGNRANGKGQLQGGIVTSFVGIALLIGLSTLGRGPWLLGGLIPLAVGLGNLLTFVILSPTVKNDGFDSEDHDGPK